MSRRRVALHLMTIRYNLRYNVNSIFICNRPNQYNDPSEKIDNLNTFVKEAEDAIQEMKLCLEKYCACKCVRPANVWSPNHIDCLRSDTAPEQHVLSYIQRPLEESPRVLCGSCSDSHLKTISEKTEICETISTPSITLDIHLKTPDYKATAECMSCDSDYDKTIVDTVEVCDCEVEEDKTDFDSEKKVQRFESPIKLSISPKKPEMIGEAIVQSSTNTRPNCIDDKLSKLTIHNMPLIDIQRDLVIQNVLKIDIQGVPPTKKQVNNVGYVEFKFARPLEKDGGESNKDERKARLEKSKVQVNSINMSISQQLKVELIERVTERIEASKVQPIEPSTLKETEKDSSQGQPKKHSILKETDKLSPRSEPSRPSTEGEPDTNLDNIDAQIEEIHNYLEEITLDKKQTIDDEDKNIVQDEDRPVKLTSKVSPMKLLPPEKLSVRPTEVWVVPQPSDKCWCFNEIVGINCKCSTLEVPNRPNSVVEEKIPSIDLKNYVADEYENLVSDKKPSRLSIHPIRIRRNTPNSSIDENQQIQTKCTSTEKVQYLDAEANTVHPTITSTTESSTQTVTPEQPKYDRAPSDSGEYVLVHDVSAQTSFEYLDSSQDSNQKALDIFATTKFEKIPSKPALTPGEISSIRSESKAFFTNLLNKKSGTSVKNKTSLKDSKTESNKIIEESIGTEQPVQVINLLEPQVLSTSVTEEPSSAKSTTVEKKKPLIKKAPPFQVDKSGDDIVVVLKPPKGDTKTNQKLFKNPTVTKSSFRVVQKEDSLSEGETLCRCSVSSGEVHKCCSRQCKCSLKRHARPNLYGNYRITREHYHSQNFVSYYISKSSSQI